MKRTTPILLSAALLAAGPALASTAGTALPSQITQGSASYVSGGIGTDEAKAMQEAQANYPLSLEFVEKARPRDEFLAGTDVTISQPSGEAVLTTVSQGPFLLVNVPDGRYTIRATDEGRTIVRHVKVTQRNPRRMVFEW